MISQQLRKDSQSAVPQRDVREQDISTSDISLRDELSSILRDEVAWKGPLPEGELGKHLDSLQCMALIVAIEDRFQICFDPEDERGILTMDDLLGCVARKLEAGR